MSSNSTSANRQHESRAAQATTVFIVCPAIATIFVALRVYTRFFLTKRHFWEDYMIVAAMVCAVGMSICMEFAVLNGMGRHIEFVTRPELIRLSMTVLATGQIYVLTHFFLKLSILLQYLRISVMHAEKRACQVLIVILVIGSIVFTTWGLARCTPFEAHWTPNFPGGRCVSFTPLLFASQGFMVLLDLAIVILPFFILRHSSLPRAQKLLVGIVLGFGGMACIMSVVRLHTLYASGTSTDPTWDKLPSGYYGQLEVNLGIVCASVVTLKPLFHHYRDRLSSNKSQDSEVGSRPTILQRHAPGRNNIPTESSQALCDSDDVQLGAMDKYRSLVGSKAAVSCT